MTQLSGIENATFSKIYLIYFPKLVRFAREYVISIEDAENIVQDIFMYLWEHRDMLDSLTNPNAFLFTLTKNRCIDFYRHKTFIDSKNESLDNLPERELKLKMEALMQFDENIFTEKEIEDLLAKAIEHLPEKCRQVFILSRMNGLKYEEIATQMDISVHTVQNHIVTAIRKLKVELKDYLPLFVFII
ncbi:MULTISPECIES: RNA polymerase sigma-70 factor [Parabacteroides]|jgi:RNA polymerase sigma-70 factor (ECF subfamily)|uniref:RNA polymerase sigma-70 factor n=1 Tax=Parabacteroides TaxID=375288 RepID=UPI000F009AE8|nr:MULTISPECIES: RNA polymerase sigma-70 factor [Parabacteroides]RHU26236.1 RNA polymerase sigma-70 factor [Parabacteroides sp. TM07-1AC]WFE86263.1 RNA polymerase sigma-70 factor [Parabacteroides chongii]